MMKVKLLLFALLFPVCLQAEIQLPHLFADHMVLQRNQPLKIWGKATPGEWITITIDGQTVRSRTTKKGEWEAKLSPMPQGGPHTMTISSKKEHLVLKDILIGDLWLCSGQSNMEMRVSGAMNAQQEIAKANHPQIRAFNVPHAMSYEPCEDAAGKWLVCSPETAGDFSAVAYFYARKIYEETGIPIGIINSSWGGTEIESWISLDNYNRLPEEFAAKYSKHYPLEKATAFFVQNDQNKAAYEKALTKDIGLRDKWFLPTTSTADWKPIKVPQSWNLNELRKVDGIVWMRYDFTLPREANGEMGQLSLSTIGDEDVVWINGKRIGECKSKFMMRNYLIAPDILQEGMNTIVIRITDNGLNGGLNGRPEDIYLYTANQRISLADEWNYRITVNNKEYDYINIWRNSYPSLTYNSMLHPLLGYSIKGVLWYQGEQNTGKAEPYRTLLPHLIESWRTAWGYEFPFYIVQLPNFRKHNEQPPIRSHWAELREAQAAALSLPQTGIIITTDLGEADDLHPLNKQEVGRRSALVALHNTYNRTDIVASGPVCQHVEIQGDEIILTFTETGSGMITLDKYEYVRGFTVAGKDKKHHWAQARLEGNTVIIEHNLPDTITEIAYNWADNPDGTLYNKEGLPAQSFRFNNQLP